MSRTRRERTAGHAANAGGPEALARYVERLGAALTDAGMPRLASRVFAVLLADDDGRMTAAELADALGVSPAAVSGAVRYLAQVSLIRRERERGTRKDVYVVMGDAWHDAILRQDAALAGMAASLREGLQAVGPGTEAGRRIALSIEFIRFVTAETEHLLDRWEAHKAQLLRPR